MTNFGYFSDYIISYEVTIQILPQILIFPFFIIPQGICLDRYVLFLGMFGDFMDKIACIVLQ